MVNKYLTGLIPVDPTWKFKHLSHTLLLKKTKPLKYYYNLFNNLTQQKLINIDTRQQKKSNPSYSLYELIKSFEILIASVSLKLEQDGTIVFSRPRAHSGLVGIFFYFL